MESMNELPVGVMNKKLERTFDAILICPYCGHEVGPEQYSCCGESSAHFEEVYVETNEKGRPIGNEFYTDAEVSAMGY